MSGYQGWTLEQHEQINNFNVRDHKLSRIIQGMQQTGHHKWGFVVYRCTYSDDEAWLRYIQYIKDQTIATLDFYGQQFLLEKYLDIPVVEDPQQLDGASKPHVRALFAERAERDRQTENGGPGSATFFGKMMPRFNYCVYVDKACLDTLLALEEWNREREQSGHQMEMPPSVVCAVIDTDCEPGGEGEDGYESVEGCTRYFPGWMYSAADKLTTLYNRLHIQELTSDEQCYERPPGVPFTGGERMPL